MRVGPVVEDVAEEVGVGADGLGREEVMLHKDDAGPQLGGDGVGGSTDHVREVLDGEGEVGVREGEGDADVAAGAADIDDGALPVGGVVIGGGVVGVDFADDGGPRVAFG